MRLSNFPLILQDWTMVFWLDEAGGWYLKERKDFIPIACKYMKHVIICIRSHKIVHPLWLFRSIQFIHYLLQGLYNNFRLYAITLP